MMTSTLSLYLSLHLYLFFFFFFNDTATTEIYTLSLHDALPISGWKPVLPQFRHRRGGRRRTSRGDGRARSLHRSESEPRSEEHTSELQSPCNLVCRLLLEKKKKKKRIMY